MSLVKEIATLGKSGKAKFIPVVKFVLEVGRYLQKQDGSTIEHVGDDFSSHHSITTHADRVVQNMLLAKLLKYFPEAYFITEEKTENENLRHRILTAENYLSHLNGQVFGIDPLDGTSQHYSGLYEWSVSAGLKEKGVHTMGIVFAPAILGGVLVAAESNRVLYSEAGSPFKTAHIKAKQDLQDAMIYLGIDIPRFREFNSFVNSLSEEARTTKTAGSCALGLALVAIGRVDVLIQPPQRVWDWFGGCTLVEMAGGKMLYYRIENGKIIPVESPEPTDYNPASKNLGVIAGVPSLVDIVTDQLVRQY